MCLLVFKFVAIEINTFSIRTSKLSSSFSLLIPALIPISLICLSLVAWYLTSMFPPTLSLLFPTSDLKSKSVKLFGCVSLASATYLVFRPRDSSAIFPLKAKFCVAYCRLSFPSNLNGCGCMTLSIFKTASYVDSKIKPTRVSFHVQKIAALPG